MHPTHALGSPTVWSLRRNLFVKKFAERDYICLAVVASFLRFFQGLGNNQMNSLSAHVINCRRRDTIIDGCQKQCAVKFFHCHLFPALTKGGFCREHHCFFECPFFGLQHHKARQHKVRAATSRYGLLFKSNPAITKQSCDVLFKGTSRTRFSVLACAQKSCVQIGKSTHDGRNDICSTTGDYSVPKTIVIGR